MNKGIKITLVSVVVLIVSIAIGFVAVFFVFDTLQDGQYELNKVYIGNVAYDSSADEWQEWQDGAYSFEVQGRDLHIYHRGDSDITTAHRLRGGLFGVNFVELVDETSKDWIRKDGSDSPYESWFLEDNNIVVQVHSADGQLIRSMYYARL